MKSQLRKLALQKRKELDVQTLSERIMNNLYSLEEYKRAKNVLTYFPLKYEVQTQACLKDDLKTWYLPRVTGDDLEVCLYDKEQLSKGNFNILEPTNEKMQDLNFINLVIIPCVAADKKGYRIGYGKGYYDRFLPNLPKSCKKVLLVYSNLLFDDVFHSDFDVCSDIVVTDKEIFRI